MKTTLFAALLLAPLTALAQAPLPTKPAPAAPKPAAPKPAAKGAVATVNGVAIPQARADLMVLQQQARGTPDTPELRSMVREELVNEIRAQIGRGEYLTEDKLNEAIYRLLREIMADEEKVS